MARLLAAMIGATAAGLGCVTAAGSGAGTGTTTTAAISASGTAGAGTGRPGGAAGSPASSRHCPSSPPQMLSPCTHVVVDSAPDLPEGVTVDGDACRWGCEAAARCDSGKWTVQLGNPHCPTSQSASCPAATPTLGDACSDPDGAPCAYQDGTICGCFRCEPWSAPCSKHTGTEWACGAPAPECPRASPNPGDVCPAEGQFCSYGPATCHSFEVVCTHGEWYATVRVCAM